MKTLFQIFKIAAQHRGYVIYRMIKLLHTVSFHTSWMRYLLLMPFKQGVVSGVNTRLLMSAIHIKIHVLWHACQQLVNNNGWNNLECAWMPSCADSPCHCLGMVNSLASGDFRAVTCTEGQEVPDLTWQLGCKIRSFSAWARHEALTIMPAWKNALPPVRLVEMTQSLRLITGQKYWSRHLVNCGWNFHYVMHEGTWHWDFSLSSVVRWVVAEMCMLEVMHYVCMGAKRRSILNRLNEHHCWFVQNLQVMYTHCFSWAQCCVSWFSDCLETSDYARKAPMNIIRIMPAQHLHAFCQFSVWLCWLFWQQCNHFWYSVTTQAAAHQSGCWKEWFAMLVIRWWQHLGQHAAQIKCWLDIGLLHVCYCNDQQCHQIGWVTLLTAQLEAWFNVNDIPAIMDVLDVQTEHGQVRGNDLCWDLRWLIAYQPQ